MTLRARLRRRNAPDDKKELRRRLEAERERVEREAKRLDKLIADLRSGNVVTREDLEGPPWWKFWAR